MWAQCLGTFHANVVRCITHAHTKPRCKSLSQQTTMSYARPNTIATTHCSNTTLSSYPVSPGVGPVPWRLPRQRNCLTTHTRKHKTTSPSFSQLYQQTTTAYARRNTIATTHRAASMLSCCSVSPGMGPVPWCLPRQCCSLTHTHTHAHTKPRRHHYHNTTNKQCTSKHHRHHVLLKSNVVMLLSVARCGPSALAPSTPMLFADITHAHKNTRRHHSHNTQPYPIHAETSSPPRTAQIQRCHVVQLRQVWAQCLGASLANVVR